jgi:hypothetical protein
MVNCTLEQWLFLYDIYVKNTPYKLCKRKALWAACYVLDSSLAFFLTLMMEAVCSSETLVDFSQITEFFSHHKSYKIKGVTKL